jgi:hypothetical protein
VVLVTGGAVTEGGCGFQRKNCEPTELGSIFIAVLIFAAVAGYAWAAWKIRPRRRRRGSRFRS